MKKPLSDFSLADLNVILSRTKEILASTNNLFISRDEFLILQGKIKKRIEKVQNEIDTRLGEIDFGE